MENSIPAKHTEQEQSSTIVPEKNNSNSSELIKRELFEDGPLELIIIENTNNTDHKFFIALGNRRITEIMNDEATLREYAHSWEFLINLIVTVTQDVRSYEGYIAENNKKELEQAGFQKIN